MGAVFYRTYSTDHDDSYRMAEISLAITNKLFNSLP